MHTSALQNTYMLATICMSMRRESKRVGEHIHSANMLPLDLVILYYIIVASPVVFV